ncbi:MAG TPA: penicillin-binding protein activator, partial [Stellaceae bacterium]|nr:penicillin-binding protein activator [Stellaceae bacterium]
MLRWRVPRFAATLAAFAMTLALAACGGKTIVAAPVVAPQLPATPPAPISAVPISPPGTAKVALLLPTSGPNAALGKAMLQAAQLALFTTSNEHLTLIPRDTAGAPAAAAHSAIGDGAQLILGPLLAADVEAVEPVASAAHVNVIAFSTATQLAGGNVFLMGFLPRQEIAREVSFARQQGLARFAALAPDSPYGHLMTDALRAAVGTSGGTVVSAEYFDPQRQGDLAAAIGRLLQSATDAPAATGAPPPPAPAPPAATKPSAIDFDALLLPEGGAQLKAIAQALKAAGLDTAKVRLLGSGLWDDPSIAGEPALYGGWFAASPPAARHEFEARFKATYGTEPPRLASLAFDAAALSAVLAERGD